MGKLCAFRVCLAHFAQLYVVLFQRCGKVRQLGYADAQVYQTKHAYDACCDFSSISAEPLFQGI
jgi:hypothetical protein